MQTESFFLPAITDCFQLQLRSGGNSGPQKMKKMHINIAGLRIVRLFLLRKDDSGEVCTLH